MLNFLIINVFIIDYLFINLFSASNNFLVLQKLWYIKRP